MTTSVVSLEFNQNVVTTSVVSPEFNHCSSRITIFSEVFMPIYEYICQDCHHEFEALRTMSQADLAMACSHCGGENIKRKISNFFAESGGKAVAGMSEPSCPSCSGGDCAHCGH